MTDNAKTVLLAFSGGLDSTLSAVRLRDEGYKVTLAYVQWNVEGSPFGRLQHESSAAIAAKLDCPFKTLAVVTSPRSGNAKWIGFGTRSGTCSGVATNADDWLVSHSKTVGCWLSGSAMIRWL